MAVVTNTLEIRLVDDVTANGRRVDEALERMQKQAAALSAALSKSGVSDKLQGNLKKLGASATQVEAVSRAWKDYAKAEGLAAKGSEWTKDQQAAVRSWENVTLSAIRAVRSEETALTRAREQEASARMRAMERETAAMSREAHKRSEAMHRMSFGHYVAGSIAAGVSAHGVVSATESAVEKGAELQHTRILQQQAGISPELSARIETRALELSTKYANVSQVAIMDLAKEARSVLNSPEEMLRVLDPLTAAKAVLDAQDRSGEASHGLGLLVKGAENIGAGKDPERLAKLIDGYVKAMQVMGRSINPEEVFAFDKNARTAGALLSDRFLLTTGLSLSQEMSGASAGKAVNQLRKTLVGGLAHQTVPTLELMNLGLVDRKNVRFNKVGEVSGVKKGVMHAVHGDDLLQHDPDLWVYKYLLPAMEAHGIKKQEDQLALVSKILPGTQAADLVSKLITQRSSYEAHGRYYEGAAGIGGAALNKGDAFAGWSAFTTALGNLEAQATSPAMATVGKVLYSIAEGLDRLAKVAKDHPIAAMTTGGALAAGGMAASGALGYRILYGSSAHLQAAATSLEIAAASLSKASVGSAASGAEQAVAGGAKGGVLAGLLNSALAVGSVAAIAAWTMAFGENQAAENLKKRFPQDAKPGEKNAVDAYNRLVGNGTKQLYGPFREWQVHGRGNGSWGLDNSTHEAPANASPSQGAAPSDQSWWHRIFGSLEIHSNDLGSAQDALKGKTGDLQASFATLSGAAAGLSATLASLGSGGRGGSGGGGIINAAFNPDGGSGGGGGGGSSFGSSWNARHPHGGGGSGDYDGGGGTSVGDKGSDAGLSGGRRGYMMRGRKDGPGFGPSSSPIVGAVNPRLAASRAKYFEELDRNPQLRRDVIKTASEENDGSPEKMLTVIESMVNRAQMLGYKSLNQAIHSGFYGPVNSGALRGGLSEKNRRDGEAALAAARHGSNIIGYRTDQGMLSDSGARKYFAQGGDRSGWRVIHGENFFYMGQQGREWAKQQEAADRAARAGPTSESIIKQNSDWLKHRGGAVPMPAGWPTHGHGHHEHAALDRHHDDPLGLKRRRQVSLAAPDAGRAIQALDRSSVRPSIDHSDLERHIALLEYAHRLHGGLGGGSSTAMRPRVAGLGAETRGSFSRAGDSFRA